MTVTETKQAVGAWELSLSDKTPRQVLDQLDYFGHIVITPGRVNAVEYGDSLLSAARYVGVMRNREGSKFSGVGMAFWLGDEDDKGDIFETAVTLTGASFAASVAALLPPNGAVTAGTINSVAGTYTGVHKYQTPRKALTYVTDVFGAEWRVNGNGTLDAGTVAQLYRTTPRAILVANGEGEDLLHVGLPGEMSLQTDVEDYTTRVVLLAEGDGDAMATGSANATGVTAKDIHGNTIKLTRLVSESETGAGNADTRAAIALAAVSTPRSAVSLNSNAYDVKGDIIVGDYLYVFDLDRGFVDPTQEVYWNGQSINPVALRCIELTWPVRENWTVAFRRTDGTWIDLSDYYLSERGSTTIVVGEFGSASMDIGSQAPGDRVGGVDSSVPGVPTFNTPFSSVAYQSSSVSDARAAVYLTWNQPLNVDSSTILDGDHYEVRYRVSQTFSYPITWAQAATVHWNAMQTWARPLSNPAATSDQWITAFVGWDTTQLMIPELMVASEYEFQIRAVDSATPPNAGAWSASVFYITKADVVAPSVPAPPEVASSLIGVQVTHRLGKSTGGTFNLESDLDHFEVHVGGPFFAPEESTLVGKMMANAGNLMGKIPVVATFQVENTSDVWVKVVAVDKWGNKSGASDAVQSSAILIDNAHISDLTASKITAGTISADLLLSGSIKTAEEGQRAELNAMGLQLYDENGQLQVNLTADDASPNFLTFGSLDNAIASISDTGDISGQTISAAEDVVIAGESFNDSIRPNTPRGVVAYGSADTPLISSITTEVGTIEVSFIADSTRNYRVSCQMWVAMSAADGTATIQIHDGGDQAPVLASPVIARHSHGFKVNGIGESFSGSNILQFTDGLHRLLLGIGRQSGTGTLTYTPGSTQLTELVIEDVGPITVQNSAVQNDGGAGTGGTPSPVTNYTKTYNATWTQTYDGSSNQKSGSTIDQGDYDSYGNRRGLIGFDWATIKNDLAGATITGVWVTMYAEHWYYNNGGTGVIGTHNYSSKPTKWSTSYVTENRTTSPNWPRGSKRKVALSTAIGNEFKAGTTKGIAVGPGPTTNLIYYGKYSGVSSSNKPVLTITYRK